MIKYPVVPENINVHLGKPKSQAENITIPFTDYISTVAACEVYPTWPKEALKANIYAITSFTLNRIYNEWYKSEGYDFDITSSPSYDQTFIKGHETYENINNIVKDVFNDYLYKKGQVQPFFAAYCDGRMLKCDGLSQWGTVELANSGMNALNICKKYYGNDIMLKLDAKTSSNLEGYPGFILKLGTFGNPVIAIERDLDRISKNYPYINYETTGRGIYTEKLYNAVKRFQEIFDLKQNGEVDKSTWYKIKYIYNSVKKLENICSEGISVKDADFKYKDELKYGDTGIEVSYLNYFLNAIALVDTNIPLLKTNGVFNENTLSMVKAFQRNYNLPVTGIVNYETFSKIGEIYETILSSYKDKNGVTDDLYPNKFLSLGSSGTDVRRLQMYLYKICKYDKSIPGVKVNSEFDSLTESSIKKIQKDYNFEVNGIVGPLLWKKIVELSNRK